LGVGVANVHVQQQPGCKCFFMQCSPVHLLAGVEPVWKLW